MTTTAGILDEGSIAQREEIVAVLTTARAQEIIEATEDHDPVIQDKVVATLRDEQRHRRLFEGFLRGYEGVGGA
jgi:ferritin-like protein